MPVPHAMDIFNVERYKGFEGFPSLAKPLGKKLGMEIPDSLSNVLEKGAQI